MRKLRQREAQGQHKRQIAELDSNPQQWVPLGTHTALQVPGASTLQDAKTGDSSFQQRETCIQGCLSLWSGSFPCLARLPPFASTPWNKISIPSPGGRKKPLDASHGKDPKEEGLIQRFSDTLAIELPFKVHCDSEAYLKQIKMLLPPHTPP